MNAPLNARRAAWRDWRRIDRQMQSLRVQIRALPYGPDRYRLLEEQRRLGRARNEALRQYNLQRRLSKQRTPQ
jgi:hypothetical protein